MHLLEQIRHAFTLHLQGLFGLSNEQAQHHSALTLNVDTNKQDFGDLNAAAAMSLAKELKKNPRELATTIASTFTHDAVQKIEIAGPGFLNLFLTQDAFVTLAQTVHTARDSFFCLDVSSTKHRFNIEFVSANPTGPLHLGHGRGGIIGDVLANVLTFLGHTVTKEFYINDAGVQITKLGASFKARCQQHAGLDVEVPEDGYRGEYLITLAQQCIAQYGIAVLDEDDTFFAQYAKEQLLAAIKITLNNYGIQFDVWFSEKTVHKSGAIDDTLQTLSEHGFLYEKEGAVWFASTTFGDDKDRVVKKSSGELTYIAADAAYLRNKVNRHFDRLIMILGHDHHSYEVRLKGLMKALGLDRTATLDIILYQLVSMKEGGQQVRMSKRAGNIVTLDDIIETVGIDVARFFYLNRKADAQLEFDLDLALKKTDENPVYYIQYAYVRTGSILNKTEQEPALANISNADAHFMGPQEAFLLKKVLSLQQVLASIGEHYQTHTLAYYTIELATALHAYYAKNRVIDLENIPQSRARLLLIQIVRTTLGLNLGLLGLSRPDAM